MAILKQCKSCEKKGVFLKLYKGLCQECTNELNLLEKHYYEIESIVSGTIEITDPNKVIDQANLILRNVDKFQNVYTPIRKALCLEIISLMENLLIDENVEVEPEPICISPETYEKEINIPPESTFVDIIEDTSEDINSLDEILEVSPNSENDIINDSNQNEVYIEETTNSSRLETILDNIIEEPITNSDINLNESEDIKNDINSSVNPIHSVESELLTKSIPNIIDNPITETIILDEEKLKDLSLSSKTEKDIPVVSIDNNNLEKNDSSFENISFEKEINTLSNNTKEKANVDKTLTKLKKILDNIEANINSAVTETINTTLKEYPKDEFNLKETKPLTDDIPITIDDTESSSINESVENTLIESKSIESLALDSILKLNDSTLSPEEKGYNLEALKSYSTELYKKGIYKLDNIDLKKFITQQETKLIKLINKPPFELFNFFNYVSLAIKKESDDVYALSAVKICYGKIIDTFYSRYSLENSNTELSSLEDVVLNFKKFIDNMLLVTYNANFSIRNLKSLFSKVNGVRLTNKFVCTRNSYIKLCSKLNIPKPNNIDLYVCLRYFLSNEGIDEIHEEAPLDFVDAIKTFKLYENLKYIISK